MAVSPVLPAPRLPVFFFHGVTMDASSGDMMAAKLKDEGRHFVALSFASGPESARSLHEQVPLAIAQIRSTVKDDARFDNGYIFVGFSLGGMISRAVVEEMDDHKVRKLVSVAGVANGLFYGPQPEDQRALAAFIDYLAPRMIVDTDFDSSKYEPADYAGKYQYDLEVFARVHPELQQKLSIVNISRSPVTSDFLAHNNFLPKFNNLTSASTDEEKQEQQRRRSNYLRLEEAHYVASPDDEVVGPWQTSILGSYSELNSVEDIPAKFASLAVVDMKETTEYQQDTYGLKTLDVRGGLFRHIVPGVPHLDWVINGDVYDKHIFPLLG
uniref:AB hydrolase-1 domain-containing protein n=1 Tax=Globisporangium ultimum (strain ATCC 200006 / CBS 805.95 / DAOM BR144) TaxID=431595 RepID=K3WY14_GLOUD